MPSTRKRRIAFDLDDTLAASAAELIFAAESCSTPEEKLQRLREVWGDYAKIELEHPSIPDVLLELSASNRLDVLTVTAATDQQISEWLNLRNIPYNGLMHVRGHDYADTMQRKVQYGIDSGTDVFVDDSYYLVRAVAEHGRWGILLRKPWNDGRDTSHRNISVAEDWVEIAELLRR